MGLDFSGSPNAGVYAEQAAAANTAYQNALTNVATKRGQLYNAEGLKVTNNPDGSIASYGVDGHNLTGAYQQLQKSEGMQLEAQHEADMARHIGSAGIGAQNTSALRYQDGVQQANFVNNFLTQNQGLVDEQTQAGNDLSNTLLNLQLQAIADARAAQNYPNDGTSSGSSDDSSSSGGGSSSAASNPGAALLARLAAATKGKGALAPVAVKVAANKTGASANKKQGIFAIH